MEDVRTALKQKALEGLFAAAKEALRVNQGNWVSDKADEGLEWVGRVFGAARTLDKNDREMMAMELLAGLMEAAAAAPEMERIKVCTTVLDVMERNHALFPHELAELFGESENA